MRLLLLKVAKEEFNMLQITKIHEKTDKFVAILSNLDMMTGQPVHLLVDEQQMDELILYKSGYGCIQDILLHFDPFEREFVKTGYGPHSQELLFGVTYAPKKKVFFSQEELVKSPYYQ